jgi:hypothetical protein
VVLKRSRVIPALYLALIAALTAFSLVIVLPLNYDYYALSSGLTGHSELAEHGAFWTTTHSHSLNPEKTILILARSKPLDEGELEEILEFVESGGLVVAYGSVDFVESLLRGIGFDTVFEGFTRDPVFSSGDPSRVLVNASPWNTTIVLDTPYIIQVTGNSSMSEVVFTGYTSVFSYIDENKNNLYDIGESIGEFPVIYALRIGSGLIVIACARGVFTNSVLGDNSYWLDELNSGGRVIALDQSEYKSNPLAYIKLLVLSPRGVSPIYITIVSILIVVVLYYVYLAERAKRL